ncbi:MAG: hypothetical protein COW63_12705 [Bacteroidetes bacterium CG18_big_fil_WC_8_21_14_2_50_41_14]|nr:MAG: hypothetical protein COW63_12705 [Bacteroidetes bacterium CG18_big_fil_WC_8_21_14_2_50_41_14]PJB57793.1 MAG: hypothetical protein CO098_10750 [Bacteroidetes bacterium CG_4_9_14_3_um_filter_41_19]
MVLFSSTRNKIILLLLISALVFTAWQSGAERVYAQVLIGTTNFFVGMAKEDTHIELENINENDKTYQYRVFTRIDGRKGNYPQETGGVMQPFVIVLSWQIFLFFVLKRKPALTSLVMNVGIFLLIQVVFLVFLTGYYNSGVQKYLYTMMLDSFYIFALILVIKDQMLYRVFSKKVAAK